MNASRVAGLSRDADWTGLPVTVLGIGVAGLGMVRALHALGARVTVVDSGQGPLAAANAATAEGLGVRVILGDSGSAAPGAADAGVDAADAAARMALDSGCALILASPGIPPAATVLSAAEQRGIPIWGELGLAWRLRRAGDGPWLLVTGTNGKTTTTLMLSSILTAEGLRAPALGNVGTSIAASVVFDDPLDALPVEVSAQQLLRAGELCGMAAVVTNLDDDHLDYFGTPAAYRAAKARVYRGVRVAAVTNAEDPATAPLPAEGGCSAGARRVSVTRDRPGPGQLGVRDGWLVDCAFADGLALTVVDDQPLLAGPNLANALAASALARAAGASAAAVAAGLAAFRPAPHRSVPVGEFGGIAYVDDSKATNAHAAAASFSGRSSVVWIAGGLAKGQQFHGLIRSVREQLRGVVLIGADRALIGQALRSEAPAIPVVEIPTGGSPAMTEAVAAATRLACPGDTVLLAPACASWDMFDDYAARGDAFTAAVLAAASPAGGLGAPVEAGAP